MVLGLDVTKPAKMYRVIAPLRVVHHFPAAHVSCLFADRPPARAEQPEILRDIVKPANQGDYFLKAMLSNADRFYTRAELVHHAIRALFQLVWNKKAMDPNGVPLAQKVKVTVYQVGVQNAQARTDAGSSHRVYVGFLCRGPLKRRRGST